MMMMMMMTAADAYVLGDPISVSHRLFSSLSASSAPRWNDLSHVFTPRYHVASTVKINVKQLVSTGATQNTQAASVAASEASDASMASSPPAEQPDRHPLKVYTTHSLTQS